MVKNQKPAPDIFLEAARAASVWSQNFAAPTRTPISACQAIRAAGMEDGGCAGVNQNEDGE